MSQTPLNQPAPGNLVAEVISIGDEMTAGARLDTNAQWLSRRLSDLGVSVAFHTTVGDTLQHNIDVFRVACSRVDIVISTGGLGPTRDDLTRDALSALVDQPLELRGSAMEHIESLFARRRRQMPERNRVQAMFPRGSREIFNPEGTAPGIDLDVQLDGKAASRVYALPGVPAEMKRMFDDTVSHRILEQTPESTKIRHCVMKFFGCGESEMEHRLGEMISRDRQPRVGITVSTATISLRITAVADTDEACHEMIERTRNEILSLVPEYYFGDGEQFEQYHAIDAMLRERNESMMVIELGRAAPLGDWFASLGETPGYRGGLSLATMNDLTSMYAVGTDEEAIERARESFGVDWVLLVDAYPLLDESSDTPQRPAKVRMVAAASGGRHFRTKAAMGGHPAILQPRIAKTAMAWMRKILARR